MEEPSPSLNGDMGARVAVDTEAMAWTPSPSGTVLRKRLHLVGPPEGGQVTSVVRYAPGASFPRHPHPEGEEILVLDGVFSDHLGDWGAGTYLLSPEGFEHAPWSEPGCRIFVKLRQYAGEARERYRTDVNALRWEASELPGVETKTLYRDPRHPDVTRLERWAAGAEPGKRSFPAGAELFVIEGAFEERGQRHATGAWLRLPPGDDFEATSSEGCRLYVKIGGVAGLRSDP